MTIEERLDALEDAHRALSAQHTALLNICRVIFPVIPIPSELARSQLTLVYDMNNRQMEEHGFDDEYSDAVRRWIDVLSSAILSGGYTPPNTSR